MQQKLQMIGVFLVTALVFFVIGYVINSGDNAQFPEKPKTDCPDKTFQDGWDAAKDRLNETKYCFVHQEKFTEVEGEVLSVNSDSIKVKIRPLTPLADPELDNRTLQITENTHFYKLVKVPEAEFKQKMKDLENKNKENNPFPERYNKEKIKFKELKEGEKIRAVSVNDKDIKRKKVFKVSEILLKP